MAVPGSVELSEITSGALFVAAQQWLKKYFPQLQGVPTWVISLIWAIVSVLIIGYEWTPNAGGGGVLTITVPSLMAAVMGLWKLGEQFALNEIIYAGNELWKGNVKPETPQHRAGYMLSKPEPSPSLPQTQTPIPQPYPSQPPIPPSKYSMPEAQK